MCYYYVPKWKQAFMQFVIFRWCKIMFSFTSTNNLLLVHFVKFAAGWLVVYLHNAHLLYVLL